MIFDEESDSGLDFSGGPRELLGGGAVLAHFGVHFLDPKRGPQNVIFLRWLCNPISKSQNAASLTLWSKIFHGRHPNLRVRAAFHAGAENNLP